MVKCYLNLSIFTVFLKNQNFISKMRISKVTDYAALSRAIQYLHNVEVCTTVVAATCKIKQNMINPYKPIVLFVGHRQTVLIHVSLIRFSTVCLQNVLSKFELK